MPKREEDAPDFASGAPPNEAGFGSPNLAYEAAPVAFPPNREDFYSPDLSSGLAYPNKAVSYLAPPKEDVYEAVDVPEANKDVLFSVD